MSLIIEHSERVRFIRESIPSGGLFAGHDWRIAPAPFQVGQELAGELERLGRVLLQFYRAANLLYRQSREGKQPEWAARWLDQGKPQDLLELQTAPAFKNDLPRVIRPDLLLTEDGIVISELDSIPGGIGLTAWLNETYGQFSQVLGGPDGMIEGFRSIFPKHSPRAHIVISEESATYRPEMEWLAGQLGHEKVQVRDSSFAGFEEGDAIYRFFELFDLRNVPNSGAILEMARAKRVTMTPPPKAFLEEKMLFALLWNRNLRHFWRQQLGETFLRRMQRLVPYTWLVDPSPLPPHGGIPELNLTNWDQLKTLSQKERRLILKISGFSEEAWGARGVYLGNDLSYEQWSEAVGRAVHAFERSPYILQRYLKPKVVQMEWFDFDRNEMALMQGRTRLCPYYFVSGEGDAARARLGGVLATICPADKKIIHGMKDAIMAPCAV